VSCDEHSHLAGLLFEHTARADILVAAGVPGLICGEHVKDGVIAVDVGINAISDPQTARVRLVGDIDTADVARRAEALTPVPGGVWSYHRCLATPEHRGRRTARTGHRGVLPVDRGPPAAQPRVMSIGGD